MYRFRILVKRPIKIFIDIANNFYNENSKSSIKANSQEDLALDISYEILKCNFEENCKFYDEENFNYDTCKESFFENETLNELNCSVPYKSSSHHPVCRGQAAKGSRNKTSEECLKVVVCDN